ncbi:ADP-ribosylglycohydrolase family protein [Streptomyces oryzae]|uniref:ADP-ribosylglycohydrolase family protein n=1 Tax=Streptomyces oryzae TaxID=1434886 RepID=A0ABS3X4F2_9ACTN|nr:ADP-ribosylglycohydrolase family protein [Streptomyces oryzae]MBO8190218.1 ADP-ribosylglycohydrolase family protein [Streptomyces oryzae]
MSARFPAPSHGERISHALASLRGLAVGDALGSQFFVPDNLSALRRRELPPGLWKWTDDTEMAASVVAVLAAHGHVDQDALAASFAEHHDFFRGYGPAVNRMLRLIHQEGGDWRELAAALFDGQGSWGNGGAMRVAPLGAWFADDPERAAEEAERSATVTHRHPEAVAGTRAVAAAAALVAGQAQARPETPGRTGGGADIGTGQGAGEARHGPATPSSPAAPAIPPASAVPTTPLTAERLLARVQELVPRSAVQAGLRRAADMLDYADVGTVAAVLGCGRRTSTQDTVPFTLWAAARNLGDFRAAFWTTASAGGDVDTTCAIVGGIVAAGGPASAPPEEWRDRTEGFPGWLLDAVG